MKVFCVSLFAAVLVAGCQSAGTGAPSARLSAGPAPAEIAQNRVGFAARPRLSCGPNGQAVASGFQGRTIAVRSIGDIKLGPREVVLTFDDGPIPKKTRSILDTLDRFGVKATFFVVGRMARSYPATVREVAARGHSVGSHTENHPNLARLSHKSALIEIAKGERAIAKALSGSGESAAPFFRFPYLADTRSLRASLANRGTVVIDVDIDSKDYYRVSPQKVAAYTLKRLRKKGRGVILFHDIHARTVAMLPGFLTTLKAEGYKVVHLAPPGAGRAPTAGCITPAS